MQWGFTFAPSIVSQRHRFITGSQTNVAFPSQCDVLRLGRAGQRLPAALPHSLPSDEPESIRRRNGRTDHSDQICQLAATGTESHAGTSSPGVTPAVKDEQDRWGNCYLAAIDRGPLSPPATSGRVNEKVVLVYARCTACSAARRPVISRSISRMASGRPCSSQKSTWRRCSVTSRIARSYRERHRGVQDACSIQPGCTMLFSVSL